MNALNTGRSDRRLHVLIPACHSIDKGEHRYAWLNGYCALRCRVYDGDVHIRGEVLIGQHIADNSGLISRLADALDPLAILVGMDLTAMISKFGRIPIDADDQAPALALLAKLRMMLEENTPIDLTLPDDAALDSLNHHRLAKHLTRQASACLLAASALTFDRPTQRKVQEAWQAWRERLVPVLPEREVEHTARS